MVRAHRRLRLPRGRRTALLQCAARPRRPLGVGPLDAGSTLIASQLPVDTWHAYLGEPTLADAILDRLVHQSHRIELKVPGESMRKVRAAVDAGASPRPEGR